ncbi:hypothetical protein [Sphingomonas prati]|uniref:Uncharacterized protein n=1 Tax=Sphingomonas prati TaxID=1843237 RepID=A0A7W9BRG8_9SPHN|nr:hypothetical protein [Sphingomonas prati]MBB5728760.1 hypothetical protein [Sphingomonas prati]GGE87785.1 hypothetical protein GCM10011404_20720 [Sphingomonas prati]
MNGLNPDDLADIIAREEAAAASAKCERSWKAHTALARNYRWQLEHEMGDNTLERVATA